MKVKLGVAKFFGVITCKPYDASTGTTGYMGRSRRRMEYDGACAHYVMVSNHFGLPPSEFHRMTGLPPKIV